MNRIERKQKVRELNRNLIKERTDAAHVALVTRNGMVLNRAMRRGIAFTKGMVQR